MSLRKTLNRLLQVGRIQNVKMTKTVIEHDARDCQPDCAICQQVKRELEEFGIWKMEDF